MMQFLGCLFLLGFVAILFVLSLAWTVIDRVLSIFLPGRKPSSTFRYRSASQAPDNDNRQQRPREEQHRDSKGKIFPHDDSEYVDFEEV